MNRIHHWYCASAGWRRLVETEVMPWALDGVVLRGPALEIGPGPGVTTDYLSSRVEPLTVLERDPILARQLRQRFRDTHVRAIQGDATAMPFPSGTFRIVFCFTMLHHVPSASLQDRVIREAMRVLVPGGVLVGADSQMSLRMRIFHWFDTLVVVDPHSFPERLRSAGFTDPQIELSKARFRFRATRA
jgi:ubiquinone/menaquinone biosynthesis C-methylase UbiE